MPRGGELGDGELRHQGHARPGDGDAGVAVRRPTRWPRRPGSRRVHRRPATAPGASAPRLVGRGRRRPRTARQHPGGESCSRIAFGRESLQPVTTDSPTPSIPIWGTVWRSIFSGLRWDGARPLAWKPGVGGALVRRVSRLVAGAPRASTTGSRWLRCERRRESRNPVREAARVAGSRGSSLALLTTSTREELRWLRWEAPRRLSLEARLTWLRVVSPGLEARRWRSSHLDQRWCRVGAR